MYRCEQHGAIDSEWCDACKKIVSCDCKDQTYTKFKDMLYDCNSGERSVTIRLHHCETCGMITGVEI